jgi:glycosyltransferase involved in cell wall biosynthesis
LTVLSVAYPLAAVGPDAVGGAEQVLSALDHALIEAGHQSLVIARDGSRVHGRLIPTTPVRQTFDEKALQFARHQHRLAIQKALVRWSVDLVHLHGIDFPHYLPPSGVPVLVTLHLPPAWYPREAFANTRPDTYLHCVSVSQQAECPPYPGMLPPIENGVAIPTIQPLQSDRNYALAIGRICPEKGFHLALDAASRAGVPLVLAGQVFPYEAHQAYFRSEIEPRLQPPHRYEGVAGRDRKNALYAGARCVLVPSLAPETSSLVAMEAMAHGAPVIAYPLGALRDLISHGRTGFLVNNVDEMADAIRRVDEIDREECRAHVREHYSLERMTGRYLEVYGQCCAWSKSQIWSSSARNG